MTASPRAIASSLRRSGKGTGAALLLPVLILVVLVALVAGCGTEDGSAAAPPSAGPAAFPDESWAELATDGNGDLWLAVAGYERSGDFGLRIFRRDGSAWEELPVPPGQVSRDLPISIAAPDNSDGVPCLGYSAGSRPAPVVACLDGGEWQALDVPSLGKGHLLQLVAQDGDLVALVGEQRGSTSRYRLIRDVGEEWTSTPTVSAPPAVARLAIKGPQRQDANFPGIGFATQGRRAKHFVAELRDGSWQRLQPTLQGVGTGPLVGGPVLLDKRILYPVNEADTEPWIFSVQTARIGSAETRPERLSIGAGNAQGRLDVAGGRVWATWQEHEPLRRGGFRTVIYAAELRPDGKPRRMVRLWRGVSIGPGSTQVVEFQGRTLALYMRSSSDGQGLQAAVKGIP
jgi:hypothetical protein